MSISGGTIPVSIVVPTFNEERRLPNLLRCIEAQAEKPREVIVSDAHSTDRTREIAGAFGAKVVDGGVIAVGRNNGAKAASQDIIFFVDADNTLPDARFLRAVYDEFVAVDADVGSTLFTMDTESRRHPSAWVFFGVYMLMKQVSARMKRPFIESGFFFLAKKSVLERLGWFQVYADGVAEDLDLALKAIDAGFKYHVVRHKVRASARRYYRPWKAIKVVIGSYFSGLIVRRRLYDNQRLVNWTARLYGKLGGG